VPDGLLAQLVSPQVVQERLDIRRLHVAQTPLTEDGQDVPLDGGAVVQFSLGLDAARDRHVSEPHA
jgi:hypothetical protein